MCVVTLLRLHPSRCIRLWDRRRLAGQTSRVQMHTCVAKACTVNQIVCEVVDILSVYCIVVSDSQKMEDSPNMLPPLSSYASPSNATGCGDPLQASSYKYCFVPCTCQHSTVLVMFEASGLSCRDLVSRSRRWCTDCQAFTLH